MKTVLKTILRLGVAGVLLTFTPGCERMDTATGHDGSGMMQSSSNGSNGMHGSGGMHGGGGDHHGMMHDTCDGIQRDCPHKNGGRLRCDSTQMHKHADSLRCDGH